MTVIKIIIALIVLSEIAKRIRKSEKAQAHIKKALGIASPSKQNIYLDPGHGGPHEK